MDNLILFSIDIKQGHIYALIYLGLLIFFICCIYWLIILRKYSETLRTTQQTIKKEHEEIKLKSQEMISDIKIQNKELQDELKKMKHITTVFTNMLNNSKGK